MRDLVAEFPAPLALRHRPAVYQASQDGVELIELQPGQHKEVGNGQRALEDGQQLEHCPGTRVDAAGPRGHPLGQPLRKPPEARR
jgi:hypothetical protein